MHPLAVNVDSLGVEIDLQAPGLDHGLGMTLRPPHDGVDAGDELVLMEGLGHIVVGAEAEPPHLVLDAGKAGQDEDRGLHLAHPQGLEHLVTAHVGEVQIEQNNVVVVDFAEVDALFTEVGLINVKAFRLQHQLDALGGRAIVLDQKNPHVKIPRLSLQSGLSPDPYAANDWLIRINKLTSNS